MEFTDFQCNICKKYYSKSHALNAHIETVHANIYPYECKKCDKKYDRKAVYDRHMLIHVRPFVCSKCPKDFTCEKHLKIHNRFIHDKENNVEDEAGDDENDVHLFSCDICKKILSTQIRLDKHYDKHENDDVIHSCETCNQTFTRKDSLNAHIRAVHENEINFFCPEIGCNASFFNNARLQRHLLTHGDGKPFSCPIDTCNYSTIRKDILDLHMKAHLQMKTYVCDECGESFVQLSSLYSHNRTHHSDEKPLLCDIDNCNYRAKEHSTIKAHQMRHHGTQEKTIECPRCDLKFYFKNDLNQHMMTHLNLRPHKCPEEDCNYSATFSTTLKRHLLLHSGERPFCCLEENCGYTFNRSEALKTHMFMNHTKEGQGRRKKEEQRIAKLLEKNNIRFKREHYIDFRCGIEQEDRDGACCYIDFLIDIYDENDILLGFVFLEIDENQHEDYEVSCETRRMMDVYRSLIIDGNSFPILFIRYNPNAYQIEGKKSKLTKVSKEAQLIKTLKNVDLEKSFGIMYMFYNTEEEIPCVFNHPDYNRVLHSCLVDNIYSV